MMADTYPTLGRVRELLDAIEARHGILEELTDQSARLALGADAILAGPDDTGENDHHG